jgi:ligand-binding sensor domain-containing protein/two-component sensor histidine kinase
MRKAKILVLSFCFALLLPIWRGAFAQVTYYNFDADNGLPSNEVYNILQDKEGYLWFATDHGVVKYDGYNFKTYTTTDGLTDNTVFSIKQSEDSLIWFLTLTGGICYYDGKNFKPHPSNDTIKALSANRIPVFWYTGRNSVLWLSFVQDGFYKIEPGHVTPYITRQPDPVKKEGHIYTVKFRDGQSIATSIYSNDLTTVVDTEVTEFESFSLNYENVGLSNNNFNLLELADGGKIISQGPHVLYLKHNKIVKDYTFRQDVYIVQVRQTSDKKIWVLNKNAQSFAIEPETSGFQPVDSLLKVTSTTDILCDAQGNYWVTTLDKGIFFIPNRHIKNFTAKDFDPAARIFFLASNGEKLYASLNADHLLEIDKKFNAKVSTRSISSTTVLSIIFEKKGTLLTNVDVAEKTPHYLVKIIESDSDNVIAGGAEGLFEIKKTGNSYRVFDINFRKRVTDLCRIGPANYLVGTYSGLYYLNKNAGFRVTEEVAMKDIRITSCKASNKSLFAVATRGKGVYVCSNGHFYPITEKDGLISNLAEDVYFENDTTLWVGSFKGLAKVYLHGLPGSLHTTIRNYNKEDGLGSNQINYITGFNGYIWLATNDGLCYFRSRDLQDGTMEVPLSFGDINVNGIKRPADSLNLNSYQNNLSIEFNALYFKAISGIRYKVRLNQNDAWKYTNQNYIQYYNLPPGNYHLEVAADDKFGKYRSQIHALNFTINPHFTNALWFKMLIVSLIVSVAGIIIYMIFSYERLKARNVINLLQAEFKALSYQINPHFIFNVLNSIQYYILRKDTDNAVHLLSSFSLLIRRIVTNSKQQYISVIEEVECLKEYLDLEKMRLDNKFEYEINIDSSIDIEKKNILPMIIQPLVENSIWHGILPMDRPGKIKIDFKQNGHGINCTVEDNGVGINRKKDNVGGNPNNLSLAMTNVRERLKIIGDLNDSTWAVKTEDKSLLNTGETGTVVTIIFPEVKV